jgi:DeoR family transcriptional regulator, aga operon transcriptional repressor
MENRPRLLGEERRRRIIGLLKSQEAVTVDELVKHFGVSAVTIRADLDDLDRAGALLRSHGGALKRLDRDVPLNVKETLHHAEKARIGKRAAQMVAEGDTVILDSGTTTVEIARQIGSRDLKSLTVITNALNVALELSHLPQIRVIMLGGILRPVSQSLVGPQAEQTLKDLNADRLFLGVDGLDLDVGLTTPDVVEAQLNAMMIRVSREVVVVADSSKFNRRSLSVIAKLTSVHRIVTDSRVAPPTVDELRARNIEVFVV